MISWYFVSCHIYFKQEWRKRGSVRKSLNPTKMNSSSPSFLSLFLLLLVSPISSVVALLRAPLEVPSISAEKLIRGLNLFPNKAINIVGGDDLHSIDAPKIVERRFNFPNLVDPSGVSAEDLGHHAGYYRIQHSHDARWISWNMRLSSFSMLFLFIFFSICMEQLFIY